MRIVHVTDCYLPRLGGIETQVADLARHQISAGHDVHVVTTTTDRTDLNAHVHRIRSGWVRATMLGSQRAARIVADLDPDIVHCHNSVLSPLAISVAGAAADLGVPTAITVHSLLPAVGPLLPISGSLLGMRAAAIAWSAVSKVAAAPVQRVLGGQAVVDVLPNAVDVAWWRAAGSPPRPSGTGEVRVITVGRMAMRKRPLPLVDIMSRVRNLVRVDVPIRLTVVGSGPQQSRVRRRIRELGMSGWVDLPGQLDSAAIRDVLAAADVYAAPATLESFGIAALEARSVGLPIVAKARGGVGEFVTHNTDGILATTDLSMADALAHLIESPELRATIRAHNSAVVPAFGWDTALARTDRLYARAAELAAPSRILVRPVPAQPVPGFQEAG